MRKDNCNRNRNAYQHSTLPPIVSFLPSSWTQRKHHTTVRLLSRPNLAVSRPQRAWVLRSSAIEQIRQSARPPQLWLATLSEVLLGMSDLLLLAPISEHQ